MCSLLTKTNKNAAFLEFAVSHDYLPLKDQNWAERWCLHVKKFKLVLEQIVNFEVRVDDVFLIGFTKCGTTWLQETVWLLMNQLDYKRAKNENVLHRSLLLDFVGLDIDRHVENIAECNMQKSPRLIKSHMPANLLPKQLWEQKQKTIYVARNAKDVVVSSYHFFHGLGQVKGTLNDYVQDFINNEVHYSPFWDHVVDFWRLRHEPHIFFITYEEMKRDLVGVIQKLCDFLGRPPVSKIEMKAMLEHLSFDKMKKNRQMNCTDIFKDTFYKTVNDQFQFMRRGVVGSYKEELTIESQLILNEWTRSSLAKYDLKEEDIFGDL